MMMKILQDKDSFYGFCVGKSSKNSSVNLSTSFSLIVTLQLKFFELITHRMFFMKDYLDCQVPQFRAQDVKNAIDPVSSYLLIIGIIKKSCNADPDSREQLLDSDEDFREKYSFFFEGYSGYQAMAVNCIGQFAAAEKNSLGADLEAREKSLQKKRTPSPVTHTDTAASDTESTLKNSAVDTKKSPSPSPHTNTVAPNTDSTSKNSTVDNKKTPASATHTDTVATNTDSTLKNSVPHVRLQKFSSVEPGRINAVELRKKSVAPDTDSTTKNSVASARLVQNSTAVESSSDPVDERKNASLVKKKTPTSSTRKNSHNLINENSPDGSLGAIKSLIVNQYALIESCHNDVAKNLLHVHGSFLEQKKMLMQQQKMMKIMMCQIEALNKQVLELKESK